MTDEKPERNLMPDMYLKKEVVVDSQVLFGPDSAYGDKTDF